MKTEFWDQLRREIQISPSVNIAFKRARDGVDDETATVELIQYLVAENADLVNRLVETALSHTAIPAEPLRPEDRAQYVMSCTISAIRKAYGESGSRFVFSRLLGDIEELRDLLVDLKHDEGYVDHD